VTCVEWNASDGAGVSLGYRRGWYTGGVQTVWSVARGRGGDVIRLRGAKRSARQGRAFSALSLFLFFCQKRCPQCPGRGAAPLGGAPPSWSDELQAVLIFVHLHRPAKPPIWADNALNRLVRFRTLGLPARNPTWDCRRIIRRYAPARRRWHLRRRSRSIRHQR